MMHQCWFIDWNKCTTLMVDEAVCVTGWVGASGERWELCTFLNVGVNLEIL